MMTSRNITVFITGGTKKLELDEPFLTGHDTTIQLKRATVFWKFRNITTANNNSYFDKVGLVLLVRERHLMMGIGILNLLKND